MGVKRVNWEIQKPVKAQIQDNQLFKSQKNTWVLVGLCFYLIGWEGATCSLGHTKKDKADAKTEPNAFLAHSVKCHCSKRAVRCWNGLWNSVSSSIDTYHTRIDKATADCYYDQRGFILTEAVFESWIKFRY